MVTSLSARRECQLSSTASSFNQHFPLPTASHGGKNRRGEAFSRNFRAKYALRFCVQVLCVAEKESGGELRGVHSSLGM